MISILKKLNMTTKKFMIIKNNEFISTGKCWNADPYPNETNCLEDILLL